MSESYKKIVSRWYPKIYSIDDVKLFVKAGRLTAGEYKQITGEDYA